jgi:hypothetical protein
VIVSHTSLQPTIMETLHAWVMMVHIKYIPNACDQNPGLDGWGQFFLCSSIQQPPQTLSGLLVWSLYSINPAVQDGNVCLFTLSDKKQGIFQHYSPQW